jgi:hypothetical protein
MLDKSALLKLYPEYERVYGPYKRKDGRQHCILHTSKDCRTTISYPKALVEVREGKRLSSSETVDHLDQDFTNDSLDNLVIRNLVNHSKLDCKRRNPVIVNCTWCNNKFEATRDQLRKGTSAFCCSSSCRGQYAAAVQHGKISKGAKTFEVTYYTNKDNLEKG